MRPGRTPLRTRYLPGGIGAVAFDQVATGRLGGPGTLVAFSSGSLLNLAQGRFGPHPVSAVRWIVTLGNDYGVVAVHRDAPYQRLQDVVTALQRDSGRVVFGAGGTLGSQDWVKAALLVRAAGQDHKRIRFVSFEGGGEALRALGGRDIDIFTGDAAKATRAAATQQRQDRHTQRSSHHWITTLARNPRKPTPSPRKITNVPKRPAFDSQASCPMMNSM